MQVDAWTFPPNWWQWWKTHSNEKHIQKLQFSPTEDWPRSRQRFAHQSPDSPCPASNEPCTKVTIWNWQNNFAMIVKTERKKTRLLLSLNQKRNNVYCRNWFKNNLRLKIWTCFINFSSRSFAGIKSFLPGAGRLRGLFHAAGGLVELLCSIVNAMFATAKDERRQNYCQHQCGRQLHNF